MASWALAAVKYSLAVGLGIGSGYWIPTLQGAASLHFALSDHAAVRDRLSCEGIAEARLFREPDASRMRAEIGKSVQEAFLDIGPDGSSLSFMTGGAVRAGHREGEPHQILSKRGNVLYSYSFTTNEISALAFDKQTGHLMWVKNGGLFPDSAFAIYLHCR